MWLALEASTYEGSVAVLDGERVVAERAVAMRGATEERLMPAVAGVVAAAGGWGAIDAVFVGAGPGSFTSLRIAASIAKGVAQARGLELWAGSSLALAAAAQDAGSERLAVSLDAMRGEVFLGLFRRVNGRLTPSGPWQRLPRLEALTLTADHGFLSTGLIPEGPPAIPRAADAGRLLASGLAHRVDLDSWEPDYGRLAEAQVKWEQQQGRPLPLEVREP